MQEVEKLLPLGNEVLVKIHTASVNVYDYRSMQLGIVPKKKIFGADFAGVVNAVGTKFDLILSENGSRQLIDYKKVLISGGRLIMVEGSISQIIKINLFGSILSIGDIRMQLLSAKSSAKDLAFIIKLVEDGKIKPVIDRLYPLHETSDAIKYLKQGHAQGKVVISVP